MAWDNWTNTTVTRFTPWIKHENGTYTEYLKQLDRRLKANKATIDELMRAHFPATAIQCPVDGTYGWLIGC